jgi:hypothetical protein
MGTDRRSAQADQDSASEAADRTPGRSVDAGGDDETLPMIGSGAIGSRRSFWQRIAWLPIPALLLAIIAARLARLPETYQFDSLRLVLSFTFYTLVSLGTLLFIGRNFLASGEPGSTFHFTVRLLLAKEIPAHFEPPPVLPAAACGPLRILLVEDNPANQKLAAYILQDRGHVVEMAGDGCE